MDKKTRICNILKPKNVAQKIKVSVRFILDCTFLLKDANENRW